MFERICSAINRVLCCKSNPDPAGIFRGNNNVGAPQNVGGPEPAAPWANQQPPVPWGIQQPAGPWGNQQPPAPWGTQQPAGPWANQQPPAPWDTQQTTGPWGNQPPAAPCGNQQPIAPWNTAAPWANQQPAAPWGNPQPVAPWDPAAPWANQQPTAPRANPPPPVAPRPLHQPAAPPSPPQVRRVVPRAPVTAAREVAVAAAAAAVARAAPAPPRALPSSPEARHQPRDQLDGWDEDINPVRRVVPRAPVTAAREVAVAEVARAAPAPHRAPPSPPEARRQPRDQLDGWDEGINPVTEVRRVVPRAPVTAAREVAVAEVARAAPAPHRAPPSPPEARRQPRDQLDGWDEGINPVTEISKCDECLSEFGPEEGARMEGFGVYCAACLDAIMEQLDVEVRHAPPAALEPTAPPSPPGSVRQMRVDLVNMINPITEIFKCDECQRECAPREGARVLDYGLFCLVCLAAIKEQLDAQDENDQEWQMMPNARPVSVFRQNQLNQLMELEELELVLNTEEFTYGVCLTECEPGEGAVLRECLHTYCRDCLAELIRQSDDEVKCPYREEGYACDAALRESEVRALLTAADYKKRLSKTLRLAGARMTDAFHCRTPNCAGWCVRDDGAEIFECPLCAKGNCLRCQAIHEGKTCQQYADEQWNDQARLDIEQFMNDGTAMNCPTCDIVVMKDDGCDWVRCALCKTEICWARRMVRWGPGGRGDNSGGCQCHVGGKLCHPQCNNCH